MQAHAAPVRAPCGPMRLACARARRQLRSFARLPPTPPLPSPAHAPQAAANVPSIAKAANPSNVNALNKDVQAVVSEASQKAAEAVIKQGGSKEEANAAANAAAKAAVESVNKAQKEGKSDLAGVAKQVRASAACLLAWRRIGLHGAACALHGAAWRCMGLACGCMGLHGAAWALHGVA